VTDDARREAAYWRHLLLRIAEDLEHTAGLERDPKRRAWLASRAMRVRQRLHEGMPASFEEPRSHTGMTPRSHMTARAVRER
jgi:hypothetical protein